MKLLKLKNHLVLFVVVVLLISCGNKAYKKIRFTGKQIASMHLGDAGIIKPKLDSIKNIDLNPFLELRKFNIKSMIKEIKVVSLETKEESLIDEIFKIKFSKSYIYIQDLFKGGGIIIFDKNGKFIRRIPNGKGPGEIFRLQNIAIDEENNKLIAYQYPYLYFYNG